MVGGRRPGGQAPRTCLGTRESQTQMTGFKARPSHFYFKPGLAEDPLEERERIGRLAALDPAQDILVALGGGGVALGILWRSHVGNAALVAVQDGVDTAIEAVDVVAQYQPTVVHEGGLVGEVH